MDDSDQDPGPDDSNLAQEIAKQKTAVPIWAIETVVLCFFY
jgi:hypothetical protein